MNLDELQEEILMFSRSSTDCYEADFCRKYIPKLIAVAKAAQVCMGDGVVQGGNGGIAFYIVENRFAERVKTALKALDL